MKSTIAGFVLIYAACVALGANYSWTGNGTDNNWSTAANWSGGIAPVTDGTSSLIFSGNTQTTANNIFTTETPFSGIHFANDGSSGKTSSFTLTGNQIKLSGSISSTAASGITDLISLPIILGDNLSITLGQNHHLTINHTISEGATPCSLFKSGSGNITLSAANTYTGATKAEGGSTWFSSINNIGEGASSFGAPTNVEDATIIFNSRLIYTGDSASTDRSFATTGGSAGVLDVSSANTTLTLNGTLTIPGGTLFVRGTGNIIANGKVTGSGAVLHTDKGTLTLANPDNDFAGKLQVSDGTIEALTLADSGVPCSIGNGSSIGLGQNAWWTIGKLRYIGNVDASCNRAISIDTTEGALDKGGIFESATPGITLTFSGNIAPAPASETRQPLLQLTGIGDGEISGAVSGSINVEKTDGIGTWTLSGSNTYAGDTRVLQGTLNVNSSTHEDSSVQVIGDGVLGGTGTINGPVTVSNGGTLMPSLTDSTTLTLNNTSATALTLNQANLAFNLGEVAGECSNIALAGTLVLQGHSTIALNIGENSVSPGTYTLMTFNNHTGTGTVKLIQNYPNITLTLDANTLYVTVADGGSFSHFTWQGDGTANLWDTTTANWLAGTYTDNSKVLFNDEGSDQPEINITPEPVAPYQTVVDTSSKSYTFTGEGITGSGSLIKRGNSGLVLDGNHSYTGDTTIEAGSLTLKGTLNGSAITVAHGAAFNAADGSSISGADVSIFSLGSVVLSGNNTYGGETILGAPGYSNLVLKVTHNNALGSTENGTTLIGGTSANFINRLELSDGITITGELLTMQSDTGRTALVYPYSNGTATWNGDIHLDGGSNFLSSEREGGTLIVGTSSDDSITTHSWTSLSIRGGGTVTINSSIKLAHYDIYRDNAGTFILNEGDHSFGTLHVVEGIFMPAADNVLPVNADLVVGKAHGVGDATVNLDGFDLTVGKLSDGHQAGGSGTQTITSGEPATLIINNSRDSTFTLPGSTITGEVTLKKLGTANLTLGTANTYSGATIVSNGTLTVTSTGTLGSASTNIVVGGSATLSLHNSAALNPRATVTLPPRSVDTAKIYLDDSVEVVVDWLYYDTSSRDSGTYGATGSGADHIDDTRFAGPGILRVLKSRNGLRIIIR